MTPENTKTEKRVPENEVVGAVLVAGAGIGGMQAALDLADSGFKVYLLDSAPAIGGTMAKLDKTFPTNECAMCIMAPKLVECARHRNIELLTYSEIDEVSGSPGHFRVRITKKPRFIDETKCTGCGLCMANCPVRNEIYILDEEEDLAPVQLAPEDRVRIEEILHEQGTEKEALVSILQSINASYNYLPENVLRYTARELGVPLSLVYRISTFYAAFSLKPRGKHIVTVCRGTACHVKGAGRIMRAAAKELKIKAGETTKDMKFTLEAVRCLGCCGLAPVMMVGEDFHGHLTESKVAGVLAAYRNV